MAATGSVGLIAIFVVDFFSLLYISWLGDPRLTAGVGFATLVLFLATAINVGLMIAVGALVSRALGARDRRRARRIAGSALVLLVLVALLVAAALLPVLPVLLGRLGRRPGDAAGRAALPVDYAAVQPADGARHGCSGILRAVGDARRAMYVTLVGALVTAGLDPLLIFGLGLGTDGAAISTVVSRLTFAVVGLHGAVGSSPARRRAALAGGRR